MEAFSSVAIMYETFIPGGSDTVLFGIDPLLKSASFVIWTSCRSFLKTASRSLHQFEAESQIATLPVMFFKWFMER